MLNGEPVSCCLKKQSTVGLFLIEAEYITLTLKAKKATWLQVLLTELGLLQLNKQHILIKGSE